MAGLTSVSVFSHAGPMWAQLKNRGQGLSVRSGSTSTPSAAIKSDEWFIKNVADDHLNQKQENP